MQKWPLLVLALLPLAGCSDKPSDASQKQIEQEHQKAMEEQKKLTSGEGDSMLRDEPPPNKNTQPGQKPAKPKSQPKPAQQSQRPSKH
jgi:hypothetical protein